MEEQVWKIEVLISPNQKAAEALLSFLMSEAVGGMLEASGAKIIAAVAYEEVKDE